MISEVHTIEKKFTDVISNFSPPHMQIVFFFCEHLIIVGLMTSLVIILKMWWYGNHLNFINIIITVELTLEVLTGFLMTYFFFDIAYINFYSDDQGSDMIESSCQYYITFWLLFYIQSSLLNAGIIFCRYVYVR